MTHEYQNMSASNMSIKKLRILMMSLSSPCGYRGLEYLQGILINTTYIVRQVIATGAGIVRPLQRAQIQIPKLKNPRPILTEWRLGFGHLQ